MTVRVTEEYAKAAPGTKAESWLFDEFNDDQRSLALAVVLSREAQSWRDYNALFVTVAVDDRCAQLENASKQVIAQDLASIQVGDHYYRAEKA